jgi:hypothetical protein
MRNYLLYPYKILIVIIKCAEKEYIYNLETFTDNILNIFKLNKGNKYIKSTKKV